jgi:hypothetical protein
VQPFGRPEICFAIWPRGFAQKYYSRLYVSRLELYSADKIPASIMSDHTRSFSATYLFLVHSLSFLLSLSLTLLYASPLPFPRSANGSSTCHAHQSETLTLTSVGKKQGSTHIMMIRHHQARDSAENLLITAIRKEHAAVTVRNPRPAKSCRAAKASARFADHEIVSEGPWHV